MGHREPFDLRILIGVILMMVVLSFILPKEVEK